MNDFDLLREYAVRGSETAFTRLVEAYVDLVYSAALRQTGDPQDAEEVTQAVFLILAHKAHGLRADTVLCGWLLQTTRFVAWNVRRRERRRIKTEQEAMNLTSAETDSTWKGIAPVLDEALIKLSEKDRAAVALRFFEKKSFKEIGHAMGTSDDVAQKRVSRAVEKLRADFARRGVARSAALITGAMVAGVVKPAPSKMAESVNAAVASGASGPAMALAKMTLAASQAARLRWLAMQSATVALVAVAVWLTAQSLRGRHAAPSASANDHASMGANAGPTESTFAALSPANTAETNASMMHFRVVDETSHAPVSRVRLTLVWATGPANRMTNVTTTDQAGMALLPLESAHAPDWEYRIEVYRDGYVPKYVSWSELQGDSLKDIPTEYTTQLSPGTTIGGVVLNDLREPVPGARVVFDVRLGIQTVERERLTVAPHYHVETTDSEGHWQCNHVPVQFAMINFTVSHWAYASHQYGSTALGTANSGRDYLATADLRKGTAMMTVHPGAVAGGLVVDEAGNAVPGAKVTFNRAFWEPMANLLTGADGRFRFTNMHPKTEQFAGLLICFLTAQAEGFAPADITIEGSVPPAESRLTLARGAKLRGRVVDEKGVPISHASVEVCSHSNLRRFEWKTATDIQGEFEWQNAPPWPEFYVVDAAGYEPIPEIQWAPDGTEHKVTLRAIEPSRFYGQVVDAETGQALEKFEVWMSATESTQTGSGQPMSRPRPRQLRATGQAGEFSFTNRSVLQSYTLEARADGYCPAETQGRGPVTQDIQCAFQLKRSTSLSGVAQLPDGSPVVGAVVMLCTEAPGPVPWYVERSGAYIRLPGQFDVRFSGVSHIETDALGRFSFAPKANASRILVASPEGFTSVSIESLRASPVLTLRPWGRVAGVLKIGSQPGPNQTIDLIYTDIFGEWTGFSLFLQTQTDASGQFAFEGVPPGPLEISYRPNFRDGLMGTVPQNHQMQILVQAGQTTQVSLGGTGRKVVGKIKLAEPDRRIDWRSDVQWLTRKPTGVPTRPERRDFASEEEFTRAAAEHRQREWEFWRSEAGKEERRRLRRYVLEFDENGAFKIEDVVPGTYELEIRLFDSSAPVAGAPVGSFQPISTLKTEVIIPESPDGAADGLYDLGVIQR